MIAPFNHPKPQVPAHLRVANRALNTFNRALDQAIKGRVYGEAVMEAAEVVTEVLTRKLTPAERAEQERYEREVTSYNAAVTAHNEQVRAARQAKINAAEVATVRAGACPSCFVSHAGGPDAC